MANQTTKKLILTLWGTWCNLEGKQRSSIASELGPLGHVLNIAANIQDIAHTHTQENSETSGDEGVDENIIDAEFEEVDP